MILNEFTIICGLISTGSRAEQIILQRLVITFYNLKEKKSKHGLLYTWPDILHFEAENSRLIKLLGRNMKKQNNICTILVSI